MKSFRSLFSSTKVDKFSKENCDSLCRQVISYEATCDPTPRAVDHVVECIRALSEVVLWGDKFDPDTFYIFLESGMMGVFLKLITHNHVQSRIKVQIIQTLTILLQNLENDSSVFSLLSNNIVNRIISSTSLNFGEEEVMSNYISFLKSLSLRLNENTIQFFYHKEQYYFPLYSECLKFFKDDDRLVRTSVRSIALNVFKVTDPAVREYIEENGAKFFNRFAWFLHEQCSGLHDAIARYDRALYAGGDEAVLLPLAQMRVFSEDIIDDLLFVNDLVDLPSPKLVAVLVEHLQSVTLDSCLLSPRDDAVNVFLLAQWLNTATAQELFTRLVPLLFTEDAMHRWASAADVRLTHTWVLLVQSLLKNRDFDPDAVRAHADLALPARRGHQHDTASGVVKLEDAELASSPSTTTSSETPIFTLDGGAESVTAGPEDLQRGETGRYPFPALPDIPTNWLPQLLASPMEDLPYSIFLLRPTLHSIAHMLRHPETLRLNSLLFSLHTVMDCLRVSGAASSPQQAFAKLLPDDARLVRRVLATATSMLRRRCESLRQELYETYVTHSRPADPATTTPLTTSSLVSSIQATREVFDPVELLYARVHGTYAMHHALAMTPAHVFGNDMLHDPVPLMPALAPFTSTPASIVEAIDSSNERYCRHITKAEDKSVMSPPVGAGPVSPRPSEQQRRDARREHVPAWLSKMALATRCPSTMEELENVEVVAYLLARRFLIAVTEGRRDTDVSRLVAANKARYPSGTELSTSELSDRCGMVGVRCQFCPPPPAGGDGTTPPGNMQPQYAPVSPQRPSPGTVLYLFAEKDSLLLIEPSTSLLGRGVVTFCFPLYYTEAVVDTRYAFKMCVRCESPVHGAQCSSVILAFRDTTTCQAVARHVNGASASVRKASCHALEKVLQQYEEGQS
eukprot:PhM_4_TR17032/c0_g1_i1/m.94626/K19513/CLEC16A; protein CLEC16A